VHHGLDVDFSFSLYYGSRLLSSQKWVILFACTALCALPRPLSTQLISPRQDDARVVESFRRASSLVSAEKPRGIRRHGPERLVGCFDLVPSEWSGACLLSGQDFPFQRLICHDDDGRGDGKPAAYRRRSRASK
jgi:hypothetical protein